MGEYLLSVQNIVELENTAREILTSKKWENAAEHLSVMNKNVIESVAKGKGGELSEIMLEYVPHALEQGRQALTKTKRAPKKMKRAFK